MFGKFTFVQKGEDEISVRGGITDAVNVMVDNQNSIVVRPPVELHKSFPGATGQCRGIFNWKDKSVIVFCFADKIFKYVPSTDTVSDITPVDPSHRLTGPFFGVSFAATPNWLLMSDGGASICAWSPLQSNAIKLEGQYAPPADLTRCVGLGFLDGYVLAADEDQEFFYTHLLSETSTTPPTWNAVGLKAEALPDKLVALRVYWREIYLFGESGCEVWYNSGQDIPFSRVESVFLHSGTVARDSVVFTANQLFWVDNENRIVQSDGRNVEVISGPIELELGKIERFDRIIAFNLANFVVFTFMFDRKTFVYDIARKGWLKWAQWDEDMREYNEFPAYAAAKMPTGKEWIVGGVSRSGLIDFVSIPPHMLDYEEHIVKAEIKTNVATYETLKPKFTRQLNIFLRGDRS